MASTLTTKMTDLMLNWGYSQVPDHTREALENYLIRGYPPGSFLKAVLCNDLVGATGRADATNLQHLKSIVTWIVNNVPINAWQSEERVYNWCIDKDGQRTAYATPIEQQYMWNKLKEPANG